jgi:hypothetical protein
MADGSWLIYVADVADKGLPAALMMDDSGPFRQNPQPGATARRFDPVGNLAHPFEWCLILRIGGRKPSVI